MIEVIQKIIIIYAMVSCIISCLYICLDSEVNRFYEEEIEPHPLFGGVPKYIIEILIFLVGIFVWPKWLLKDISRLFKKK